MSDKIQQLEILFRKVLDKTILPKEREQIVEILKSDSTYRQAWCDWQLSEALLDDLLNFVTFDNNCEPLCSISATRKNGINPSVKKRISIAAASLLFLLLMSMPFGLRFFRVENHLDTTMIKTDAQTGVPETNLEPKRLGVIVRMINVQWKPQSKPHQEWSPVFYGDQFSFLNGSVEIFLDQGVHLILEGPTELDFIDFDRVFVNRGKLTTRVGVSGIGFTIETPSGVFVDRGTEFGLEVDNDRNSKVVVFQGQVDFYQTNLKQQYPSVTQPLRLNQGEGIQVVPNHLPQPITTIQSDDFLRAAFPRPFAVTPLITSIQDNNRNPKSNKYYEVVSQGFVEDSLAFVDRIYQWNGVTSSGLPKPLVGGDLIRTFNEDKWQNDYELNVTISKPAEFYVLVDIRSTVPDWLLRDFVATDMVVGLDEGILPVEYESRYDSFGLTKPEDRIPDNLPSDHVCEIGPGKSIDRLFKVWKRNSTEPGEVRLGALGKMNEEESRRFQCFYGIVAVPLQ